MQLTPITLSRRELQVAQALACGRSEAEIAARLELSTETVKSYREQLEAKLGARSVAAAIDRLWQLGLFDAKRAEAARSVWARDGEQLPWIAPTLSRRELAVAEQIAFGRTSRETAALLDVGLETVKSYRASLRAKLNAPTAAAALSRMWELGLRGGAPAERLGIAA